MLAEQWVTRALYREGCDCTLTYVVGDDGETPSVSEKTLQVDVCFEHVGLVVEHFGMSS